MSELSGLADSSGARDLTSAGNENTVGMGLTIIQICKMFGCAKSTVHRGYEYHHVMDVGSSDKGSRSLD